jgi:hypothetical protein
VVPPAHTPPHLKQKEPINASPLHTDPPLVSTTPLLSVVDKIHSVLTPVKMTPDKNVSSVSTAPLLSVIDHTHNVPTLAEATPKSLTSGPLVSATPLPSIMDGTHAVLTPVETTSEKDTHIVPPVHPKCCPTYKSALEDRTKAESTKTAVNDPNKKPAKAVVTKKPAKPTAHASPAVMSIPVVSSTTASDSRVVSTGEEGQGSWRHHICTAFGLLHVKEVEGKNKKLAQKRANWAKAGQKMTVKQNVRVKK